MFLWELLITSKVTVLFVASHFLNSGQNRSKIIPRLAFARVNLNFSVTLQMLHFHKIFEAGQKAARWTSLQELESSKDRFLNKRSKY